MNRECRSKFANERRPPTPPPEPKPEPYDSDSSEHSSGTYIDSASQYEAMYLSIPTRQMFRYFNNLRQRVYENTRRLDMDTLREFGVERDFLCLTGRVGFTSNFWAIEANSYTKRTHEFLSSLELKEDTDEQPYIKFWLC